MMIRSTTVTAIIINSILIFTYMMFRSFSSSSFIFDTGSIFPETDTVQKLKSLASMSVIRRDVPPTYTPS